MINMSFKAFGLLGIICAYGLHREMFLYTKDDFCDDAVLDEDVEIVVGVVGGATLGFLGETGASTASRESGVHNANVNSFKHTLRFYCLHVLRLFHADIQMASRNTKSI